MREATDSALFLPEKYPIEVLAFLPSLFYSLPKVKEESLMNIIISLVLLLILVAAPLPAVGSTFTVAQAAADHLDKYGRGESYWRERMDRLREKLKTEEMNYDVLVQQERECENKTGSAQNCTSRFRDRKIQIQQTMENLKKSIEIDLPEEARKAEAYPGWLR